MRKRHVNTSWCERCWRHGLWLLALAWGAAVGQQADVFEPGVNAVTRNPALYGVVAEHLCGDAEYRSCLEVSEDQCRRDLQAEQMRQCGDRAYVTRLHDGDEPPEPVPPGMVECVYVAHMALRELDASAVNQCMTDAKLRESSTFEDPKAFTDLPGR